MARKETDKSAPEVTENIIRERAYQLFEEHGYQDGRDLDDWLQAEAEVTGRKPVARADQNTSLHNVAVA